MAHLDQIKDPTIKKLFLTNRGKNKSKSNIISSAFPWSSSPEGHEFWRQVSSNLSVSFGSIKYLLPKGYILKYTEKYTVVKSLYRKVKNGMQYKAVTIYGTKFSGIIHINEVGDILLCNKSSIGISIPRCTSTPIKGYGSARNVKKGTVANLKSNSVAKIEILCTTPETIVKPEPKTPVKSEPTKTFFPVTSLDGVKSGTEFTAKIERTEVTGKIQFEDGRYFLCQNKKDGTDCKNKLGYDYSWVVDTGTSSVLKHHGVTVLKHHGVTNLKIEYVPTGIPTKTPEFKGLQVNFCEDHVIINGVKITDEQLQGIAIAQGVFEVTN